ncbi:MAG: TonB-dependent receptor plug domain-containing protein [Balneolaceae bacterium]|nr:TonB-dependent receptor plug domain-containing protein [Balneolaceae bacterium]
MKYFLSSLLLSFLVLFSGCASSGSSASDNTRRSGNEVIVDNPDLGLDTYIRRLSGVRVSGSGANARIDIRGAASSTIQTDSRPLFIVDDVRVGRDFSRVYNMLNMNNVYSVEVVKMSRATVLYGHEGSNGVISIQTKGDR